MGFSPRDVDAMSLWQFLAAVNGWNASHGGKADAPGVTTEDMIRKRAKQRSTHGGS